MPYRHLGASLLKWGHGRGDGPPVREAVVSSTVSRAARCSGGSLSCQPQKGTLLPSKVNRNMVRQDLRILSASCWPLTWCTQFDEPRLPCWNLSMSLGVPGGAQQLHQLTTVFIAVCSSKAAGWFHKPGTALENPPTAPSCCAQLEPGRYTIFLFIISGCIQQLFATSGINSSFRHWGLSHCVYV